MTSHRIEIIKELRALEQFCTFKAVRTGEENERFLKDYLADIQEYPFEAIQKACAEWRKSGATKFPTPGQLIPLIRKYVAEPEKPRINEPWRPLSEAEYGQLTLAEKVRHQKILAHEARCKAGAKWRNPEGSSVKRPRPGHLTEAEMNDTWREWTARAEHHEAEAHRLMDVLIGARRMAAQ